MQEFSLASLGQLWRYRKWYFLVPALLVPLVATIIAYKLPPVYESRSVILIEEQQIPPDFVRSLVTGYADQHVQILTQQILSRPRLWEIVEEFNLYAEERQKLTKEAILDQMRRDISFRTISAEVSEGKRSRNRPSGSGITIAFSIAYQGKNPLTVQKVTSKLTSLYLEQNLKYREEQAQTTTRFLEAELNSLREQINILGGKIAQFKERYPGALPELSQFNLSQMVSLENEIKRLDTEIQTAESQKIFLEGLLGAGQGGDKDRSGGQAGIKDPRTRLAAVNEELTALRARFSPEHPDIQRLLREKAQLEELLKTRKAGDLQTQQRLAQLQTELAVAQAKFSDSHPEVKRLKNAIAQLLAEVDKGPALNIDVASPAQVNILAQVQQLQNQIQGLKQLRQKQAEKLALYRQRLEDTPKIEQEYLALQRDYQNAHAKYQEVMNKLLEARISEGMEQHQKGERFTVVDPPSYPEEPVRPKRGQIILIGWVLGLGLGVALAIARESLDPSIKNAAELANLTKTPPIGVIMRIITPFDIMRQRRRRQVIAAVASLSLVAVVLMVHFFYLDLHILMAKFQRLLARL